MHAFGGEKILDAERDAFKCAALALFQAFVRGLGHGAGLVGRLDNVGVEGAGLLDGRDVGVG